MFDRNDTLKKLDREFHKIAGTLRNFDLQQIVPGDSDITLEDIFGALNHKGSSGLFMGFYSQQGFVTAFERYGIIKALRERGFDEVKVKLDLNDPYRHRLVIHFGAEDEDATRLVDLWVRRVARAEARDFAPDIKSGQSDLLLIEWLTLQNPKAPFTPTRPPFPGQRFPGLGIGPEVMELLQIMAERLGLAGLLTRPNYYHNAVLYSARYHFIDPIAEGRLMALMRDLAGLTLAEASWAVALGAVEEIETAEPIEWIGREQLFPIHRAVARYFESANYRHARDKSLTWSRFRLDRERFEERKGAIGARAEARRAE